MRCNSELRVGHSQCGSGFGSDDPVTHSIYLLSLSEGFGRSVGWSPASNSEAGRAQFEGRAYRGEDASELRRSAAQVDGSGSSASHALSSHLPRTSTMTSISQSQKGRDVVLPTLDVFIQALNIAKDACGIPPAQIALGFASTLLTMIQVRPPLLPCEYGPRIDVLLGHFS
jgi:hypothetical protein